MCSDNTPAAFNSGKVEGAGGAGGGTAFGQGSTAFDLDDVSNFVTMNSGSTTSMGYAFGVVGLDPEESANFFKDIFGPNAYRVGTNSGNP
jgi:hypothetical protein